MWLAHYDAKHELRYIITSKAARDFYFLYELRDGKFVKLGKDKSPLALEKKFIKS